MMGGRGAWDLRIPVGGRQDIAAFAAAVGEIPMSRLDGVKKFDAIVSKVKRVVHILQNSKSKTDELPAVPREPISSLDPASPKAPLGKSQSRPHPGLFSALRHDGTARPCGWLPDHQALMPKR